MTSAYEYFLFGWRKRLKQLCASWICRVAETTRRRGCIHSHQEVSTVYSTAAAAAPASAASKKQSACPCCKQAQHALSECSAFKKLGQKARFELVKRHRLCFSCLASGHATKECGSRKQCSEPDCKYRHHVLLHKGKAAEKAVDTCGHTGIPGTTRVLLRVLPVTISGPKGCVETLALLDKAYLPTQPKQIP